MIKKGSFRFYAIPMILISFLPMALVVHPALAEEEVKEVALDFDDVDIRLFIRVISELTGKNFIIDNNVRGKVTVLSPKKLTTQQAYEVFQSVLAVNGFTVVDAGQVTKIIPAQNMTGQELYVSSKRILKGEDRFITQIIPLKYLDAKQLQPLIKPLLSKQGTVLVPVSSDLFIITDYKSNIVKVDKLLDEIDIQIFDQIIEKLELKYSSANLAASKMTEILDAKYSKKREGTRTTIFKLVPIDRVNAIIAVADPDVFMEIRSILSKIDRPTPEGKNMLNVYYLENAKAEEMVAVLTQTKSAMTAVAESALPQVPQKTEGGGIVTGGKIKALGEEIIITADKATNSLIIYSPPEAYTAIKEMITMLDIPRKQVFIQALIMEVSPNENFDFGTEWAGFRDVGHPFTDQSRTAVFGSSKVQGGPLDTLITGESIVDLGTGFSLGALGEAVTLGNFVFPSLSVMIKAVETLDTTNILSKPQLMTLNNEQATINISENRPFQTTSTILEGGGTSQNIEYRDVGIILKITPYINQKGKIRLELSLEVSKLSGAVTANQPITRKRTIDTFVEVEDKGTIVIGGLVEQERNFSKNMVPCLSGIPYLGWGFKEIGVSDTQTNLLVFISPRVLERAEDVESFSSEKKEYIENELKRDQEDVEREKPQFRKREEESRKRLQKETIEKP